MGDPGERAATARDAGLLGAALLAGLLGGPAVGDALLATAALLAASRGGLAGTRSLLLLAPALLLLASHLVAADAWASTLALTQWLRVLLALLVGSALPAPAAHEGPAWLLGRAAAVVAVLLAAHGAWQVLVLQPALLADPAGLEPRIVKALGQGRANSVFMLPGHYGALAAALGVLLGGLAVAARSRGEGRRCVWTLGGVVASLVALAFSGSITTTLLLAGGAGLIVLATLRGRARLATLGLASLLAVIAVGAVVANRSNLAEERPAFARTRNWIAAERLVRERPVLGWGGGAFAHEYARVRPAGANETRHAHQFALERAAEHGLWTLPLFAALLAWLLREGRRHVDAAGSAGGRALRAAPLAASAVLLGHGLFDFGWSQARWAVPAALIVGAAVAPLLGRARPWPRRTAFALAGAAGLALMLVGGLEAWERRTGEELRSFARAGDHASAASLASSARRKLPFSSQTWAWESEAVLAASEGKPELAALAVQLAEEAIGRSPRRASLHGLHARALLAAGRPLEAWLAAERAAALAPTVDDWARLRSALRPALEEQR